MGKDNVIIIGYYKKDGDENYTVYTEDSKTYEKETFGVPCNEIDSALLKLKAMYPNHNICEFKY